MIAGLLCPGIAISRACFGPGDGSKNVEFTNSASLHIRGVHGIPNEIKQCETKWSIAQPPHETHASLPEFLTFKEQR